MRPLIVVGKGVIDWVGQRASGYWGEDSRGIGLSRDGKIIAGVVFTDFNGKNVKVHQAIEGRINRQYLWTLSDYAFNQLKAERVTGEIPQGNRSAQIAAEKIGFKLETRLKDAHPSGDILVYVIRKKDCRWLNAEAMRLADASGTRADASLSRQRYGNDHVTPRAFQ